MRILSVIHALHPRSEFRISRARRREVRNVFLRIDADGITGYGEASPNAFYNETAELVVEKLAGVQRIAEELAIRSVADIEKAWTDAWPLLAPSRAAQCALDLALWDWLAKREGASVSELVWGEKPRPVQTFCTIGLSSPDELDAKIAELRGFPLIKIKSDTSADLTSVRLARERTRARIAVDANCAWDLAQLRAVSRELAALGVEFVEQPLPPARDGELSRATFQPPIIADESCVTEEDVDRVARCFDGFNIKLVKCGGLTPALRMLKRGRALGARVMVGCMLESSALIASGAALAQRTDFADLDGAWLLENDAFRGWNFEAGTLLPSPGTGLGVEPLPGVFE